MNTAYQKIAFMLAVGILCANLSGCATLFNQKTQSAHVSSEPAGAQVFLDHRYLGDTPVTLDLPVSEPYSLIVKKDGYHDRELWATTSVGAIWVVLDILGGLIPVVVDASTGCWNELQETHLSTILIHKERSVSPPDWLLGEWVNDHESLSVTAANIIYFRDNPKTVEDLTQAKKAIEEKKGHHYVIQFDDKAQYVCDLMEDGELAFCRKPLYMVNGHLMGFASVGSTLRKK